MNRSETIEKLAEALAAAQAIIEGAVKDAKNPHFRSSYSTLASIWDACRAPLSSHGLAVVQTTAPGERITPDGPPGILLETMLTHASGQWISGVLPVYCDTRDPQKIGSALTYARRYGLAAIVGVCPDDDDGEAAAQPHREQRNGHAPANGRASGSSDRPVRREPPREGPPTREDQALRPEAWGAFSNRVSNERNREFQKAMMAFHLSPEERAKDENQLPNGFALTNHIINRAIDKGAIKAEDVAKDDDATKRCPTKARKAAEDLWKRAPKKIAGHVAEYIAEKEQAARVRLGMDDLAELVGAGQGASDDDR